MRRRGSGATAAILGPLLGARLGWSPVAVGFAVPYSLAVLASIRSTPAGYLQLVGRFDLLGIHSPDLAARPTGRARVVAASLHGGLLGFLVAWLVAAVIEWLALWAIGLWVVRRELGAIPVRGSVRGVTSENAGIWRFMIGANADITFTELAGRVAPLMIGWLMGPVAVGFYALAQRITTVLAVPAQVLGQAAYAELARLVAAGGHGAPLRDALRRSVVIALSAALPVVLVIVIGGQHIAVAIGGTAYAGQRDCCCG